MNWLVIVCIYSYTIGLLLCFYAGMRVENYEIKETKTCSLDFPNSKKA